MDPDSLFRSDEQLPGCHSCSTTIGPAESLDCCEAEWAGVVLVVVSGRLHLECRSGEHATFEPGAVLVLAGLDLLQMTNPGLTPLVLKRITRASTAPPPDPPREGNPP